MKSIVRCILKGLGYAVMACVSAGCAEENAVSDDFQTYQQFLSQNEVCAELFLGGEAEVSLREESRSVYETCVAAYEAFKSYWIDIRHMQDKSIDEIQKELVSCEWEGNGDSAGNIAIWREDGTYEIRHRRKSGRMETIDSGWFKVGVSEFDGRPVVNLYHQGDDVGWSIYIAIMGDELRLYEPTDFEPYMSYTKK